MQREPKGARGVKGSQRPPGFVFSKGPGEFQFRMPLSCSTPAAVVQPQRNQREQREPKGSGGEQREQREPKGAKGTKGTQREQREPSGAKGSLFVFLVCLYSYLN